MNEPSTHAQPPAPEQAIGQAIQELTAARLGRGFVVLAVLAVVGCVELGLAGFTGPGGWILVAGAGLTAAAMLAYALRNVQLTFGRPERPWMTLAVLGSLVPPAYTLYVLAWRGLREVAVGEGAPARLVGVAMAGLGWWALRSWMKVVEVQKLSRAMVLAAHSDERRSR